MRAFKTEGVVLKRRDFGEADRILTVFTLDRGKISVLAKGVRRITSRRAGNIELLNRVIIFLHQTKGMPILTEAQSLDTFQKIKENLKLSTVAFHIIELVDRLTAENQESRILYENLVQVLKRLEKNPRQILIRAFEVKILSLMGFVSFEDEPLLQNLEYASWDEIEKIQVNEKQALETERGLRYHLERVIEGSLKSRQFLKKL
jgi:DNA repair protein RecO (recombination protein O)